MIQIEETIIRKLILHRVSSEESKSVISNNLFDYSCEDEEVLLKKIFLKPFTSHSQTFEFVHEIDLSFNILFNLARNIFEGNEFIEQSSNIAQHLISSSKHHNINDGDLFVAKLDEIKLNNNYYEGIGIYKFEDKDSFIETSIANNKINLSFRKGIGQKKPDKACLIIFTEEPFTILIIDSNNETDYWRNEFIKQKIKNDFVNETNQFFSITKQYVTEQLSEEFEVSKADKIDFLNKTVDYFKKHEQFDKQEFENEVFRDEEVIESFRKFDQTYREKNDLEPTDNFEISAQAVKKQARVLKKVLKLDKNFHVYIHGNRDLIEQGIDENGRKYYKLYYEEEM